MALLELGAFVRSTLIVLFCLLATSAWPAQIFVPVDESGKPIVDEASGDQESDADLNASLLTAPEALPAETPQERAQREERERGHVRSIELESENYATCLKEEFDRLLGPDFAKCEGSRGRLRDLYAADMADAALACLEVAVIGEARDGKTGCPLKLAAAPDTTNGRRWR